MKIHHVLQFALAALVLSGCGKSPVTTESKTGEAPHPGTGQEAVPGKKLNIFCWSEYIPQSLINQFTKETGIEVSVENFSSNEEMLAKLLAGGGNYDLVQPSEYVVGALIKDNLLRPLNRTNLPNLKNISPQFLDRPFDPGNKFSVPFMAGTVGIVVNTDLIKDDIRGFADVFQDKHKQNIVILDDAREIVTWGFLTQGIPINQVTDENLAKVKPLLAKWLPLVKVFDSDSPKTALRNGDAAIGVVWGGEAAILLHEDPKFQWILPSEGTHLIIDSLAIPRTAKNAENAEAFMNFILRPDVSEQISDAFPYLNPNLAARKLLTDGQLANPASFPPDADIAKMQIREDIGQQASKVDELVTALRVQ
ncbi:MAG: spermidine/putrescine ABC transporter substrate-binding protein [Chthoniobacterales bacterium]|nr:spermidine/putrescine ABC transporter substrate-binding protein [Chthoniobacterales bacterium]